MFLFPFIVSIDIYNKFGHGWEKGIMTYSEKAMEQKIQETK
jgi:hypothetical protein